ncbi:hypothetical protein VNO78_14002 [Psophocarpus tetragonolobus]|uniref:GIR1-like zinc ribbon domain-containing protein n=1 Tax=Psophocarpus tetragonolobus TaxID=3891 RepID=A0AAN9SSJ7_PSOTE
MCKRKSGGSEMRVGSRSTSGEFSSSSSSSSVSYSSKMPKEGICVFLEEPEEELKGTNAPEIKPKPMDLVGCPQCFMYVMLSKVDPKCPKCKTTVFLEFFKTHN